MAVVICCDIINMIHEANCGCYAPSLTIGSATAIAEPAQPIDIFAQDVV